MSEYVCPDCGAAIKVEDVNVSTDVALCRACGKSRPFSALESLSNIDTGCLDKAPPRGVSVLTPPEGGLELRYRRLSPVLLFLIPFTLIWSGGSLGGIYIAPLLKTGRLDPNAALFGLPFLIGTFVMLSIIVYMIFGVWRIRLSGGEGSVFAGVGRLGWTRRFAYGPGTTLRVKASSVSVNDVRQDAIYVKTDGVETGFGALFKPDAREFIAASMLREIKGKDFRSAPPVDESEDSQRALRALFLVKKFAWLIKLAVALVILASIASIAWPLLKGVFGLF